MGAEASKHPRDTAPAEASVDARKVAQLAEKPGDAITGVFAYLVKKNQAQFGMPPKKGRSPAPPKTRNGHAEAATAEAATPKIKVPERSTGSPKRAPNVSGRSTTPSPVDTPETMSIAQLKRDNYQLRAETDKDRAKNEELKKEIASKTQDLAKLQGSGKIDSKTQSKIDSLQSQVDALTETEEKNRNELVEKEKRALIGDLAEIHADLQKNSWNIGARYRQVSYHCARCSPFLGPAFWVLFMPMLLSYMLCGLVYFMQSQMEQKNGTWLEFAVPSRDTIANIASVGSAAGTAGLELWNFHHYMTKKKYDNVPIVLMIATMLMVTWISFFQMPELLNRYFPAPALVSPDGDAAVQVAKKSIHTLSEILGIVLEYDNGGNLPAAVQVLCTLMREQKYICDVIQNTETMKFAPDYAKGALKRDVNRAIGELLLLLDKSGLQKAMPFESTFALTLKSKDILISLEKTDDRAVYVIDVLRLHQAIRFLSDESDFTLLLEAWENSTDPSILKAKPAGIVSSILRKLFPSIGEINAVEMVAGNFKAAKTQRPTLNYAKYDRELAYAKKMSGIFEQHQTKAKFSDTASAKKHLTKIDRKMITNGFGQKRRV